MSRFIEGRNRYQATLFPERNEGRLSERSELAEIVAPGHPECQQKMYDADPELESDLVSAGHLF